MYVCVCMYVDLVCVINTEVGLQPHGVTQCTNTGQAL